MDLSVKNYWRSWPLIGFLIVNYDDESYAQILEIIKYFKRFDELAFMENISELKIDLRH